MNAQTPGHEFGRDFDAEALSRVLDGRSLRPDASEAERAAQVRAEEDVDALSRAFALMGDLLADDPPLLAAAPAAAPAAAEGEEDDAKGAVVLPFAARLRAKAPILAAAASLVAIVGFGAVLVGNGSFDESNTDSAATAQAPAADVPAASAPEAAAPEAANGAQLERNAEATATASDSAATAGAPAAKADKAAKSGSAPATGAGEALSDQKVETQKVPAKASVPALDAAVACNRAVLVGTVLSIVEADGRFRLRLLVDEWISGGSGIRPVDFVVGKDYANTAEGRKDLTAYQRFLFVIPKSTSRAVYAYPEANGEARQDVADARQRQKNADC